MQITVDRADVSVVATADNVNFFTFEYLDNNGSSTTDEATDGVSNNSFTLNGLYNQNEGTYRLQQFYRTDRYDLY